MAQRFDDWEGDFLAHHGIKGQKWGVRRFQNPDGTLTVAGRAHYGLAEGGTKKMSRTYNRQMRKLNKLAAKADVNAQKAAAEKYDNRAKKAVKVGNTAAGTAAALSVGSIGLSRLAKNFDDRVVLSARNEKDRLKDANLKAYNQKRVNRDLVMEGKKSRDWKILENEKINDQNEKDRNIIQNQERKIQVENAGRRDFARTISDAKKYAAYGAAATAVVSYGVAGYNKIQSRMAKARTTDEGHAKAVEKYKKQYSKMLNQFADTPYAELVKKQRKNIK